MKLFYIMIFFISINFAGCYTIIWTPDDEFPSEGSTYNYDDGYYSDPYYGGYSYYYEYPWWLTIVPPAVSGSAGDEKTNRSDDVRSVRNSTGERNSSNERSVTPTTSRSSGSGSGTTTNSTPQSEVRNNNDSSGSSSSGTRSETRNSGSRNSGNGRK